MSRQYMTNNFPMKINNKQKQKVHTQTKSVLKTVLERCKKESDLDQLQVPFEDYVERVSYYTGFPKAYIRNIESSSNNKNDQDVILNCIDVLRCMKMTNFEKVNPTYREFYDALMSRPMAPELDYSQFKRELSLLGFGFKKTSNGYILMEDPEITFQRFHYLKRILKCRERNKHVYYIDERMIDPSATFKKPTIKDIDLSSESNIILYHIVSKDGYGNGLFCYQVNHDDFKKWILHIVLPSLKPSSVIVIDDGPLHGTIAKTTISRYDSKNNMLRWLKGNNIPCNAQMRKAELYDLIEKCSVKAEWYNIDRIFKSQGHEVLRLPSRLRELSLTEIVWKSMKSNMMKPNIDLNDKAAVKNEITKIFELIDCGAWQTFENFVIEMERSMFQLDSDIEKALDTYKLEVNEFPNIIGDLEEESE